MMREYRFRGKRLYDTYGGESGEWLHGYLHIIDTLGDGYTGKAIQVQSGTSRPWSVRVDPETVGQFIGHPDMDGTEVYKGDILEDLCTGQRFVVEWLEHESGFALKHIDSDCYENTVDWLDEGAECLLLKVVGNIHDNPELLEVGEGGEY